MLKNKLNLPKILLLLLTVLAVISFIVSSVYVVETSKVWDLFKIKYVDEQKLSYHFADSAIIYNQMPIKIILLSLLNPWLWIGSITVLSVFMFLSFVTFRQEARMLKKVSISILVLIFISTLLLSASFIINDWDNGMSDIISNFNF